LNYAFSLINALIVAKIILGGEMMHLGRGAESRPLCQAILYKSLLFGVLVFVFHIVEEVVKRIIHHQPRGTVLHNLDMDDLIARAIVIFAAFVPLFTIRELGRVLGEEKLHALLFKSGAAANPTLSPTQP
jgi:hypothetical protein